MKRIAIAMLAAVMMAGAQTRDEAEKLLKAARNTELVDGNLNAAIKQYGTIAARYAKSDRGTAAMALVRMAECYQKMGDAESRNIFERVLRDYSDQKEAVAEAQARLGRNAPRNGVVSRQVWTGSKVDVYGSVSRDGKYLSFVDWQNGGNLALHDLVNGSDRLITKDGETEYSAISRDGKLAAYAFFKPDVWRYEVRVADLTGEPKPRRLFDSEEVTEISPYDWSPDGKWIAVGVRRKDHTAQLGLISTRDGALTVLKSVDWRGATRMFFSPDGKFVAYDLPAGDAADQRDVLVMAIDGSREIPAVKDPNRNMVMGWFPNGALLFASDRSGSMGLYMLPFRDGTPLGPPRFLKADIGAFESSMGVTDSGALYFGRTGQSANVELVPVDWAAGKIIGSPVDLVKQFVGTNSFSSWSADGKYLFCISLRDPSGFGKVLVTLSPNSGRIIREFRPKMAFVRSAVSAPDGNSFAVAGTDLKGRNGIFRVDPQTGEASPLVLNETPPDANRPIQNGNPLWSPDSKSLFYTRRSPVSKDAWTQALVKLDLASRSETEILGGKDPIPAIIRLSPDGRWIAIPGTDAATKSAVVRLIPVQGGPPREIFRTQQPNQFTVPGWTPNGRSVIVRKVVVSKPASPDPQVEIWRVPIDGDPAQKLAIDVKSLPPGNPWNLSPDGRFIAISTRGPSIAEVSVLENFMPSPEPGK